MNAKTFTFGCGSIPGNLPENFVAKSIHLRDQWNHFVAPQGSGQAFAVTDRIANQIKSTLGHMSVKVDKHHSLDDGSHCGESHTGFWIAMG